MNRRDLVLCLAAGWLWPVAARAQRVINYPPRVLGTTSQQINATCSPGDPLIGQFLPAFGAQSVSAIVNSEVQATAYLDVTSNMFDERSTVLGVSSADLQPKQSQLLVLPAFLVNIQAVRLRVVNTDRTFGTVVATISVAR
ncbi:MAG: hypothetical protein KME03_17850 [Aphanocapsa lilacina HA4352-LM1]|uniref:Uncharacterized protein n=1 Tax=Gloeobacter morelensis MG652769 TaxID=2781736 RepID=A0ABY3PNY5_9CYAN|nr:MULTISPECIES: hypothetical protein [Gloeobacter]MBW4699720.1 hypothetical protein [Aphanocapsa lilacina HA4352-LM1]UFP95122.1 hypothetical protein ISF26_02390 [Gloeobacter morelensis MG652769]